MEICELTESEYESFLKKYSGQNFWQSNEMLKFESKKGWKVYRIGLRKGNQIKAVAGLISVPVFLSFTHFKILRGPMMDYDDESTVKFFLKAISRFVKEHKGLIAEMDPYIAYQYHDMEGNLIQSDRNRVQIIDWFESCGWRHQGFHKPLSDGEPRWMSVLPIDGKTCEELFKEMNSKTRRNIHFVEKNCVKVRELRSDELEVLEYFVNQTGERKHFYHPDLAYYQNLKECFGDKMKAMYAYVDLDEYGDYINKQYGKAKETLKREKEVLMEKPDSQKHIAKEKVYLKDLEVMTQKLEDFHQLKLVYDGVLPLSAALFIENDREIVYLFSGSDDSLRKWKGSYAIQWHMIQYAVKKKVERYNFYGISGNFHEDAQDYGVYIFKKGFHAEIIELPGNFMNVKRKFWYVVYKGLKRMKGLLGR